MKKLISFLIFILLLLNFSNINVFSQKNELNETELNLKYNEKWFVETIDSLGESGWYTDIKISGNESFISYYERQSGNLKIAKQKSGNWELEVADSSNDVGKYSSIAIDSEKNPHISYFDETNKDLKYAHWSGSKWIIEAVDSIGDVGYDSSIAIDQNDVVHISYYDSSNGYLKYAKRNDNTWIIEIVDSEGNIGAGSSIAVDLFNIPHISYANPVGTGLFYAYRGESNWISTNVDKNCNKVFGSTSITIDTNSIPHIAYFDVGTLDEVWYLKHAYLEKNNWNIEIIDPEIINFWYDWGVSIISGEDNIIHVAYYKFPGRDLNYAWRLNNIWSIEKVDTEGAVGSFCSIDTNNNGYPSISYMDRSNLNLKYADKKQYSPCNPEKPSGSAFGLTGRQYIFTTSSFDYDGDKISYGWDWGENENIEWTEYYNSGEKIEINHTWNQNGIFQIKVKAKDINGNEGNWSELSNFRIIKKYNQIYYINSLLNSILSEKIKDNINHLYL